MAHNGSSGPGPGPGARPGMALRVATSPSTSDTAITLTQPRPDGHRARNEYIDTPLKGGLSKGASHLTSTSTSPLHASDHLALVQPRDKTSSSKSLATASPALKRSHSTRRSLPITKQPGAAGSFSKSSASVAHGPAGLGSTVGELGRQPSALSDCSIICPDCGKCRCEACRTPKALPQKWLCQDKCLCSAGALVDYLSCLCCVKAMLYHCAAEEDSPSYADRPCSCGPQHRLARWACLAPLSLVLPCLFCYWPLKGCVRLVEKCHQQCHRHGCQCKVNGTLTKVENQVITPTSGKRLLEHQ